MQEDSNLRNIKSSVLGHINKVNCLTCETIQSHPDGFFVFFLIFWNEKLVQFFDGRFCHQQGEKECGNFAVSEIEMHSFSFKYHSFERLYFFFKSAAERSRILANFKMMDLVWKEPRQWKPNLSSLFILTKVRKVRNVFLIIQELTFFKHEIKHFTFL